MLALNVVLTCLVAATSASSHPNDLYFASLLKRQAPGTPSYNCHDNCGTAITLSRQPNACSNPAFKTNYNNCLQCAGPDNYDIWKMYGRTLSSAGAGCGLSTEPLAGKQEDVGAAVHASASSAVSAAVSGSATSVAVSATASRSLSVVPSSITASPVPSGNVTASRSLSAPVQQSTNAGANLGPVGVIGAVVLGAMAAL
ncbi:hypothetical protein DE146DRAFT_754683 [Phaeosphaeria sp. MPI-PUGE-AT-0046c]|nr:hypothetical protein DE146DRAFT_754683 [Phaeosphaeria sp. MPI-PUGE-AT-0046c]